MPVESACLDLEWRAKVRVTLELPLIPAGYCQVYLVAAHIC